MSDLIHKSSFKKVAILVGLAATVIAAGWFIGFGFTTTDRDENQSSKKIDDTKQVFKVNLSSLEKRSEVTKDTYIVPNINDYSKVERTELYVNNVFAGVSYSYPYKLLFTASGYPEGSYELYVVVYTNDGREYQTDKKTIAVATPKEKKDSTAASNDAEPVAVAQKPTVKQSVLTRPVVASQTSASGSQGGTASPPAVTPSPVIVPISTPTDVVVNSTNNITTISWQKGDDTSNVEYRIYRNGSLHATTSSLSYVDRTTVGGHIYSYSVQAVDNAGQRASIKSTPVSVSLAPGTIFSLADTPAESANESDPMELGVRFRVHVPGVISGVRFYKAPGNTGVHVGSLWSSVHAKMASVIFENETESGWQEARFETPVQVNPGDTYTVSYTAPNGHYSYNREFFDRDMSTEYITGVYNGYGAGNGVYSTTPGEYPSNSYLAANYWVDAVFTPNMSVGANLATTTIDESEVYPGYPGSNNTGVPAGKNLEVYRGSTTFSNDTIAVIDSKVIYGNIKLFNNANVTITNSIVYGYIDVDSPTASLEITDSEVDASQWQNSAIGFRNITALRVNAHGGITGINCSSNCSIKDSWLHGQYLDPTKDSHLGGFLSNGGNDIELIGNTISCDPIDNAVGGGCSGSAQLYGDFQTNSNFLFDGNLFRSTPGGYCTAFGYALGKPYGANPSNIVVRNNVWERGPSGKCAVYGATSAFLPANGNVWENNRYDDGTLLEYS